MAKYPITIFSGATVNDLAWLAGRWVGERGQDQVEEHWSGVAGQSLMGMFRWLHEGQVRFYELLVVEPEVEGVVLRIKHFDPGLKGWEEKNEVVEFDLVQLTGQEAVFLKRLGDEPLWMLYRREGEDELVTYFEKEGQEVEPVTVFRYSLM